jgi:hypothetical protein
MELVRPVVLLCPPLDDEPAPPWRAPLLAALAADGTPVIAPPSPDAIEADARIRLAAWVAGQAIAVTAAGVPGPLLLVAAGSACRGLPALGMAQRAARHAVVGYVLIDGAAPDPGRSGQDWPDAPVTVVRSPGSTTPLDSAARLRGWESVQADPADLVPDLVRRWPEPLPDPMHPPGTPGPS